MTKLTMESLEAAGFDGMIKEGPDAFDGYGEALRCFVHHRDAGGWCEREGVMQVYDLSFCEVHGAEAKAGALAELYQDAYDVLGAFRLSEVPHANVAAAACLDAAAGEMTRRCVEAEKAQDAVLLRAYPVIEKYVDLETRDHDYLHNDRCNADPTDVFLDARMHTHRLMRLSWVAGEHWMMEILELERQAASAQLAFAMEDRTRKLGQPA